MAGLFVSTKPGEKEVNMEPIQFIHMALLLVKLVAAMYKEPKRKSK